MASVAVNLDSLLNATRTNLDLKASDLEPEEWLRAFNYLDTCPGVFGSYTAVARALGGINPKTVKTRYENHNFGVTRKGPPPRLGSDIEDKLVEYVLTCQRMGCSVPPSAFSELARKLATQLNVTESVGGYKWMELFYGRHPQLSQRQTQLIELCRLTGVNRDAVARYFDILELAVTGVPPSRIYILDETNLAQQNLNGKVCSIF